MPTPIDVGKSMRKALSGAVAIGIAAAILLAILVNQVPARGMGGDRVEPAARWSSDELAMIDSMRLEHAPLLALDPSNAVDGTPAAIELGRRLYNDVRFSSNHSVSCASCHNPRTQFQDGMSVGHGVGVGTRRTMPIAGAAYSYWLFWDGRKDSLWSQALGPLENPKEHGGTRARDAHVIQAHYRREYEVVFGPLPDLRQVPGDASPSGTPLQQAAWNAMDARTQERVSRVFSNMGKAIAAYERTVTYRPSRFDRYAERIASGRPGGQKTLTKAEVNGLRLFIGKGQCVSCHGGPLLSDEAFHNTGVPAGRSAPADRGRAAGAQEVLADEFNCLGRFSDATPGQCTELQFIGTGDPAMEGAFKTPSLRNVAERAPYMHAGQFASLREAIQHYVDAPAASVGRTELGRSESGGTGRKPIRLSTTEINDLASFLGALSGPITEASPE